MEEEELEIALADDGVVVVRHVEVVEQQPRDVADRLVLLEGDAALLADDRRPSVRTHHQVGGQLAVAAVELGR